MKKFAFLLVLIIASLFGATVKAQTNYFTVGGGGALPTSWSATNNIAGEPIDKSSYYLLQPGSPGDEMVTASYNLCTHTSATFSVDIGSFGSGTHRRLKVEVSLDGGTSYTQTYYTNTTTSSTETTISPLITITPVSSQVVLRLSVDATSGRGIRMQNLILDGNGTVACGGSKTVIFNGNGHDSGSMSNQTASSSTPLTANAYGQTGCTFNEWNTASDGSGTSYADGASYSFAADVTLYAQWNCGGGGTCANELFDGAGNSSSYGTINWTGDDAVDWTATDARGDQDLNASEAVLLRNGSLTNDASFPNGCGVLSFDYARVFTGNSTLKVFVNGTQYGGDITVSSTTSANFSVTINVSGNIDVELRNSGNRTLIDNLTWSCYAGCVAPTTQPTNVTFGSVTSTSMIINWTDAGDGDEQIVVVHEGSAVDSDPTNGTGYTADNDWTGTPEEIGTDNFVVYTGDAGPVTVNNLSPNTDYYVSIYEYHTADDCYYLTSPLTGNTTTLCDDPSTQPSSVSFSSVTSTGFTVDWTGGNGSNSIVLIKEAGAVDADPVDGTTYTADTDFSGSPEQIGTGNYVVYTGSANSVAVTGLTPNVTYHVAVYEFNNSSTCYNTISPEINNQTTPCPSPPDNVSGFAVTPGNESATITWTNPTYCFDELLIVAEPGTIGFSPSGNGSGYTASPIYGSGTCANCTGANTEYVVYKGVGTTVTVTGLTNGDSYCFKVWTRNGTDWSSQDVVCSIVPEALIPLCSSGDLESVFTYSGTNPIADIDISVFIDHPYRANLEIEVESPTGTIVSLINSQGGSADHLEATFDDAAAGTISSVTHTLDAAIDETVQPVGSLSDFNGENPNGNWIIRICDNFAGDRGTLEDWFPTITVSCTPTHTITSFAPTTGPEETAVTVTGTGFTTSTTAEVDGIAANVQFVSSTTIIVEIPTGATDNTIDVNEGGCVVSTASDFTMISDAGLCGGGSSFTDLIISEVYDSDANNVWYIELFNPTGSAIDLGAENYTIERYSTAGDASPTRTIALTGTIAAGSTFLLKIGTSSDDCTETWDFTESGAGINEDDGIMLVHNGTDADWVECPGNTGYTILRDPSATGPTTTWSPSDWTTDNTEDCSDLGDFGVTYDTNPSITDEPDDLHACSIVEGVTATAGSGGGTLTYQWLYNDGTSAGWSNVTAGAFPLATVSGETSANLSITGTSTDIETYDGYQFYCLCTEDGSCNTASDAAQFRARSEDDPEMITAMINSCDASCGSEGYNEFMAIEIGDVAVDVTTASNLNIDYGTSYPANTSYADGFTADATLTADFNTAAGCALFTDATTAGTIPAHAVVLVMSENACADAYDFTDLCGSGPFYLLYSTDGSWGSTGNFSNGSATTRYFSVDITDVNGLVTSTDYEYEPNSLSGSDGDYAEFEYCAAPAYNYGNDACSVRAITLPVELLFFDAFKKGNDVQLTWETASEINNDKFVIMRSDNGESFFPIGEIEGQGNSSSINRYSFLDNSPVIGESFYALYQYDFDGSLHKSDVKLVEFNLDEDFTPISIGNSLEIRYNNIPVDAMFEIFTIEGKLVKQERIINKEGSILIDLPTNQQYILRLVSDHNAVVKKIIH